MIMEVRDYKTLKLLYSKEIKTNKEYLKTCKKLTKIINKYDNASNKDNILLIRRNKHSYIVSCGNYGYIVGVKVAMSKWF